MITKLSISNCYGIDQLDATLGPVNVITGRNGSGKTSIERAVLQMIEGGHDPSMRRRYCSACNLPQPISDPCECGGSVEVADKAVVEITLDTGARFRYQVTAKAYELTGWNPSGDLIKGPKAALNQLLAAQEVDPGRLLAIDAATKPGRRELRETLQQLIPLSFEPADLAAVSACRTDGEQAAHDIAARAISSQMEEARKAAKTQRAAPIDLERFDQAVASVKATRAEVGVRQKEADRASSALQGKVADSEDVTEALMRARSALDSEKADWAAQVETLAQARREQLDAISEEANRDEKLIKDWLSRKIEEAREEARQQLEALNARTTLARSKTVSAEQSVIEDNRPAHEERIQSLSADAARLEEKQKRWIEAEKTRQIRDEFRQKARTLSHEQMRLDEAVKLLDALRISKLSDLPVPGLEITGEAVTVDGVPWQHLNTAQKMFLCVRICAYLSKGKDQRVIFLDHGEAFDTEQWESLLAAASEAGIQLVVSRVTDEPKVKVAA